MQNKTKFKLIYVKVYDEILKLRNIHYHEKPKSKLNTTNFPNVFLFNH